MIVDRWNPPTSRMSSIVEFFTPEGEMIPVEMRYAPNIAEAILADGFAELDA